MNFIPNKNHLGVKNDQQTILLSGTRITKKITKVLVLGPRINTYLSQNIVL